MNIIKTIQIALLAVGVSIFAGSCTSGSGPEATAKKFLDSVKEGNLDEAKKHVTAETVSVFDQMKTSLETNKGKKYEIVETKMGEDKTSATVVYKWEDGANTNLTMKKVEKDWKVVMEKIDMNNMFDDMDLGTDTTGTDMPDDDMMIEDTTGIQ